MSETMKFKQSILLFISREWLIISLFALSLTLRITYLFLLQSDPLMSKVSSLDSSAYLERAAAIAAGDWLGTGSFFFSGFVYPFMLAITGVSAPAMIAVQMAMDSLNTVFIYLLARDIAGSVAGAVSGILHAVSAVFIFAAGTVLFDPWVTFFVLAATLLVRVATQKRSIGIWIGAGVALGLASTAKPFVMVYPALLVACWLIPLFRPSGKELLTTVAAILLGVIAVLAPISYRNVMVLGHPSPFPPSGGFAFYLGNNIAADGTLTIPSRIGVDLFSDNFASSTLSYPAKRLGKTPSAAEASRFWTIEGLRFWQKTPLRALHLTGRKISLLLNHAEISDNYDFDLFRKHFRILRWLPDASIIIPLGLLGIIVSVFRWRNSGFLLLMVGMYGLFLSLFAISGRYRYPFIALLAVLAGIAMSELYESVIRKNVWRLSTLLIGLTALTVLCLMPVTTRGSNEGLQRQLALAYLSAGDAHSALLTVKSALEQEESASLYLLMAKILINEGNVRDALVSLGRSVDLNPRFSEAHAIIEQLSSVLHDPRESALLRAVEHDPNSVGSLMQLGEYYLEQKRYLAAMRSFDRALQIAPHSEEAMFSMAHAQSRIGSVRESIPRYEHLVALKPRDTDYLTNLAYAYFDDDQLDKAEYYFKRVLALDDENSLARYGLGLVYRFSGEHEKSRQQFRLFLNAVPPQSYWAIRARKNLEELGW